MMVDLPHLMGGLLLGYVVGLVTIAQIVLVTFFGTPLTIGLLRVGALTSSRPLWRFLAQFVFRSVLFALVVWGVTRALPAPVAWGFVAGTLWVAWGAFVGLGGGNKRSRQDLMSDVEPYLTDQFRDATRCDIV